MPMGSRLPKWLPLCPGRKIRAFAGSNLGFLLQRRDHRFPLAHAETLIPEPRSGTRFPLSCKRLSCGRVSTQCQFET
jgi:hypothetical protein